MPPDPLLPGVIDVATGCCLHCDLIDDGGVLECQDLARRGLPKHTTTCNRCTRRQT